MGWLTHAISQLHDSMIWGPANAGKGGGKEIWRTSDLSALFVTRFHALFSNRPVSSLCSYLTAHMSDEPFLLDVSGQFHFQSRLNLPVCISACPS